MERLTKKQENKYWLNCSYDEQDAIQQLGKLEDLQDELGIPLEVLFKEFEKVTKEIAFADDNCEVVIISRKVLQAINKQVEELNWLKGEI